LSARLSEVIASLRGSELSVLIAQSDLNHSRSLLDAEIRIERGVQLVAT
jgi:branched-chain amino acid transport system ATP-binding protein